MVTNILGVSYSFTHDILKRRKRPSPENLLKMVDYYGVSLDYLYGRTDKKEIKDLVWENERLSALFGVATSMSNEDLDKLSAIAQIITGREPTGGGNNRR